MPSLLVHLLLTVLCLWGGPGWAAKPLPTGVIELNNSVPSFQVNTEIMAWIDEGSHASIEHVAQGKEFKAVRALSYHPLNKYDTLWIKLQLVRAPGSAARWSLNIPSPYLDFVALYQEDRSGQWTVQKAGDTLAHADWHQQGLYPDFELNLADSAPHEVYLQVHNFKHASTPIRLTTLATRENQRQFELLGLGLTLGALLSMVALSLLRYLEHRNDIDGWAALYGLLIAATIAQITGVLNVFLWGALPQFGDFASSVMPVVAVGCTLLFMRNLFALSVYFRWYDAFMSFVGWGTIASVLAFAALDRFIADWVTGVVMLFATVVGLIATSLSWRAGSTIGRWLMITLVPQFLGLLYLLAEGIGLVPSFWQMRYLSSLGVAITMPIMLYALSQLTHSRKELAVRANQLPTQDALTGLLTAEVFQSHLKTAVQRAIDHREPLALVLVRVINHHRIRRTFGDTTGEQCLLRAVVKLQRILRDVDPAGRVGTAQFALLMEGVATREEVTERMVKLIASGLIPLPGLVPEVTLHFQAACVLLHENPVAAQTALAHLRELLAGMSSHTRRPIRFLDAVPTEVSELLSQTDSA